MQDTAVWQGWPRTIVTIVLTTGVLLGWSLPSVLGRFLPFYRVDVALHAIIVALTVLSLVFCIVFLIERSDYSRYDYYRLMIWTTVCVAVETVICFILISWLCYGNYTIVDTH
uniref:Uncharacterized protein n=1 Tax=Acrobeloides nanus TaxID=290746 RepID=A0A914CVE1_9BILA